MLAHYAEVSGRQVDDIDYYVVLAKWKLAVVLEQGYQRAGDDEKLRPSGRSSSTSCRAPPSWPRPRTTAGERAGESSRERRATSSSPGSTGPRPATPYAALIGARPAVIDAEADRRSGPSS